MGLGVKDFWSKNFYRERGFSDEGSVIMDTLFIEDFDNIHVTNDGRVFVKSLGVELKTYSSNTGNKRLNTSKGGVFVSDVKALILGLTDFIYTDKHKPKFILVNKDRTDFRLHNLMEDMEYIQSEEERECVLRLKNRYLGDLINGIIAQSATTLGLSFYDFWVYLGKPNVAKIDGLTLDHKIPKSSARDVATASKIAKWFNLRLVSNYDNAMKGSNILEEFKDLYTYIFNEVPSVVGLVPKYLYLHKDSETMYILRVRDSKHIVSSKDCRKIQIIYDFYNNNRDLDILRDRKMLSRMRVNLEGKLFNTIDNIEYDNIKDYLGV
jgi:hypothetical protein